MRARSAASAGFTYVWVLLAVAFMAAGLAAVAEVAATAMRRDKEAELLFVGDQFARAIVLYRASSPGSPQYPQRLEDLLADKRVPNMRRHLRRVYADPMTGSADWGLVRGPGGGIVGVYSRATTRPLKTANFPKGYEPFANAASYAEWRFVAGVDGRIAAATAGITPPGRCDVGAARAHARADCAASGSARGPRAVGVQRPARKRHPDLRARRRRPWRGGAGGVPAIRDAALPRLPGGGRRRATRRQVAPRRRLVRRAAARDSRTA